MVEDLCEADPSCTFFFFSFDGSPCLFYSFLFVYISLLRAELYHASRKEGDLRSGKHGIWPNSSNRRRSIV